MNIIYGVSGYGLGHSIRSKEIISHLKKEGHSVLIIAYGNSYSLLKSLNPLKIRGIELYTDKDKFSLIKTILYNFRNVFKNLLNFKKIRNKIKEFKPDLFVTDFEPLTSLLSYSLNKPLISLDNQQILRKIPFKPSKEDRFSYLLAKIATIVCVPKADRYIVLSFIEQKSEKKDTIFIEPILREEVKKLKIKTKNKVLVYLSIHNSNLINILKEIKNEKFVIYTNMPQESRDNLIFRKPGKDFIKDLSECKAIIATTGFNLISESSFLMKPYFGIPFKGQFEQKLNALFLKKSNLGTFSENPTKEQIISFLSNLKSYKLGIKTKRENKDGFKNIENVIESIKSDKYDSNKFSRFS